MLAELLALAPNLKMLVTSRAALHVGHEREFPVPPLTLPDARSPAFFRRAGAVLGNIVVCKASGSRQAGF